ncbi:MAG TPA: ATP-binding protein [Planctomycetota bacterium]|nr:ATP-binding protein [Planctomycetota bacterium]
MQRPAHIWITFAICLAVVLGAMAWISVTVLRLERAEVQAQRQAEREENVRLALWRMDSALAPIIAAENARPYFVYQSFYPLDRTFGNMFANGGSILMPSPLLSPPSPPILLHFQIEPDGKVTSPQIPAKEMERLAEQHFATQHSMSSSRERLDELKGFLKKDKLLAVLPRETSPEGEPIRMNKIPIGKDGKEAYGNSNPNEPYGGKEAYAGKDSDNQSAKNAVQRRQEPEWQVQKSAAEQRNRAKSYDNWNAQEKETQKIQIAQSLLNDIVCQTNGVMPQVLQQGAVQAPRQSDQRQAELPAQKQTDQAAQRQAEPILPQQQFANVPQKPQLAPDNHQQAPLQNIQPLLPGNNSLAPNINPVLPISDVFAHVSEGLTKPVWIGDQLVLARRCVVKDKLYIQGCWLTWEGICGWLTEEINDLLPNAQLEPVVDFAGAKPAYMMAALPVRLIPGALPALENGDLSPMRLSLLIAWACVLVAAGAVAALLLGAVSLSERRGAFVSSVTHELRTPLTTFRMYTEMLSGGMVPDEAQKQKYLNTLRVEAERLSHLVENVLAYARLERGRPGSRLDSVALSTLLEKATGRLPDRASQAGMKLSIESLPADLSAKCVKTDPSAVEQILFNLVDNACKYAASSARAEIHISAAARENILELRVRDFGPGLTREECRNLFQPFSKTAREAAHSAPGVGLGLALSRRLAREMGGDLRLDQSVTDGACFVLSMPRV